MWLSLKYVFKHFILAHIYSPFAFFHFVLSPLVKKCSYKKFFRKKFPLSRERIIAGKWKRIYEAKRLLNAG